MKKNILLVAALALLAAVSCSDLEDVQGRLDELESRVTALETQVNALNSNVEGTVELMEAGTISDATQTGGVWTITLSDGRKITLTAGSLGVGNTPVMSIDAEGYWQVDYGTGKNYVMNGTAKVKATGNDGVTPVFGVNAAGNWTVSYDGGSTFVEVKGADNKPVSALPGGPGTVNDPYFKDVKYEAGVFTLTLKDETVLTVPVVPDFLCAITGAETEQVFTLGETKNFPVTMKGVSSTVVSAPDRWNAVLSESVLSVTAPATLTRATFADTRSDVTIMAFSGTGYAVLAKIRVRLDGTAPTLNPIAALTPGEATETGFGFTVALSDADSWKYIVRKSSEAAPSAEFINESGTAGAGTAGSLTGLEEGSEYTLYVLPLNGTTLGTVAKLVFSTNAAAINDYWQAWQDGKDIVIGGVTYNKAKDGNGTLLLAGEAEENLRTWINQTSGIFFLEQNDGCVFVTPSITRISEQVLLISRYADKPVTIRPTMCWYLLGGGSLVMKNIRYDLVNINGASNATYALNNASSTSDAEKLHIEDCTVTGIQKPVLYLSVATTGIKSLVVRGSSFQMVHTTGNIQLFNFYKSSALHVYKTIAFENNVVYNSTCQTVQLFNYDQNIAQTGSPWDGTISVKDNIFYNCPSANSYVKFYQAASVAIRGNVFWADPSSSAGTYLMICYGEGQDASAVDVDGNIVYGLADGKNWLKAHSNSKVKPDGNTMTKLSEDPFESFNTSTGAYVLKAAYSAYGPKK